MKQLLKKAKYIFVFVLAVSYLGCEDIENLFPDVVSAFTYTVNEDTGTVTFINISEDANTYLWNFGDGTTSIEINPVKSYADSGTYTVTLKALNEAGASDTTEDEITILLVTPSTCTEETAQSLGGADFNLTFQTDPGSAIVADGAAYTFIDNPDPNGINTSCKVGEIVRDAALPFANNQIEVDSKFDFNANAGFKLKVWAPAVGTNVLLKLEDKADSGINTEVAAVTTTANAWEELTFDFDASASGTYDKIVLFFDINTDSGATYYIDDFMLYAGSGTCTAETAQSLGGADFNLTFQTDPGSAIVADGAAYTFIDNPDPNGINTSCKVGEIVRDAALPFANNQIEVDLKFDFNANSGFKLKVWAPAVGTNVLVKLEDKTNAGVNTEVGAVTTTANAWEELTFDFDASASGTYDKIVLFFDINTDSGATYYIDDFMLYSVGGCTDTALELPIDFDCSTITYDFATFNGASYSVVDNPDLSGVNNVASKVGEIVNIGGAFEGGAFTLDTPVDFTTDKDITMKFYSTVAVPILLKFEGAGAPVETTANHGGTGW
uniref:PKD domain-containing protein n=1 Tax=uncultured Muriicola sp. TaxID=1583102 RepID=UPI002601778F